MKLRLQPIPVCSLKRDKINNRRDFHFCKQTTFHFLLHSILFICRIVYEILLSVDVIFNVLTRHLSFYELLTAGFN